MIDKLLIKKVDEYNKILLWGNLKYEIAELYQLIENTIKIDGKIILCGNGGSAADSLHIASEFIGHLNKDRKALPAVALCSDIAVLTGLGNDFLYENIFSRQIEALGNNNDLLIVLSTSGNSENIYNAVKAAQIKSIKTCAITNKYGGNVSKIADITIKLASTNTQTVQEITMVLFHIICEILELKYDE